jgi:hypothetical protein
MSRYTLKTFINQKQTERYDHRSGHHLHRILSHPRFDRAIGNYEEQLEKPTRFEIYDSLMMKIFDGGLDDALTFVKKL